MTITAAPVTPVLFNTKEAAAVLRISPSFLRQLVYDGKGPKQTRVGKRVLYRRADLDRWIDAQ